MEDEDEEDSEKDEEDEGIEDDDIGAEGGYIVQSIGVCEGDTQGRQQG